MCLAHENVLQSQISNNKVPSSTDTPPSPYSTGSVGYHTAVARLHLLRKQYKEAEETLLWAVKEDVLVNDFIFLILYHACTFVHVHVLYSVSAALA